MRLAICSDLAMRFLRAMIVAGVVAFAPAASAAPPTVAQRIATVIAKCSWDARSGFSAYAEICKESSEFHFASPADPADQLLPFLTSTDHRERFLAAWRLTPAAAEQLGERLLAIAEAEDNPAVARLLLPALAPITRAPWIDRIVEVVRTKSSGDGPSFYVEALDDRATPETRATIDGVLDRLARARDHSGHLAALERAPCTTAAEFFAPTATVAEVVAAATRVLRDETACAPVAKRAFAAVKRRGAVPMRELYHLGHTLQYACEKETSEGRSLRGFRPLLRELARWLNTGLGAAGRRAREEIEKARFGLELTVLRGGMKACGDR